MKKKKMCRNEMNSPNTEFATEIKLTVEDGLVNGNDIRHVKGVTAQLNKNKTKNIIAKSPGDEYPGC